MVLFETGRLIHRPALPSRLITQGRFPFPTSSPSISHFSPSSVSNFSPPLRSLPLPHPTFLSPAASPTPHPTPPPAPPPPSNRGSPSTFHFIVSPGTDFSLSRRITSSLVTAVFFVPLSLSLSLSLMGKQLKEARLGPPQITHSLPFRPPAAKSVSRSDRLGDLKILFASFFLAVPISLPVNKYWEEPIKNSAQGKYVLPLFFFSASLLLLSRKCFGENLVLAFFSFPEMTKFPCSLFPGQLDSPWADSAEVKAAGRVAK